MGSLVNQANTVDTRKMVVAKVTLDQFVKAADIDCIDMIKVDIQGGEFDFLAGGLAKFLANLVMEISESDLAYLRKQPADLIGCLEDLCYRLFEFDKQVVSKREVTSQIIAGAPFP